MSTIKKKEIKNLLAEITGEPSFAKVQTYKELVILTDKFLKATAGDGDEENRQAFIKHRAALVKVIQRFEPDYKPKLIN